MMSLGDVKGFSIGDKRVNIWENKLQIISHVDGMRNPHDEPSTESQKRTSLLQIRRDFSPTRHMTRINVGLALSLMKLLLSSWKIYMCNLVAWYTNK